MGVTALLYNWGFFTMLGYVPFPMGLSIFGLGAVFFGWGVLVRSPPCSSRRGCRRVSARLRCST
jgi:hypothetical protein